MGFAAPSIKLIAERNARAAWRAEQRRILAEAMVEALKAKAWMLDFLSLAMAPEAQKARDEIEVFGVRRLSKPYAAVKNLLGRASGIKIDGPRDPNDPLYQWEQDLRSELATWLAQAIQQNNPSELESLVKVLRARRDAAHQFTKPQTLPARILWCLDELIRNRGGPTYGFSHAAYSTDYFFSLSYLGEAAEHDKLDFWWKQEPGGPHLLPQHLPTKKELRKATEETYDRVIPSEFANEFKKACTFLGLSGLRSGKPGRPRGSKKGGIRKRR